MRIFFFLLIIFLHLICIGQKNDSAIGLDAPLKFIKPDKFYIRDVIDSRDDKSLNNFLVNFPAGRNDENGTFSCNSALLFLFNKYLPKDTTLVPVTIDIRQFSIAQKVNAGLPKEELRMELRYQIFRDKKNVDFAFYSFNKGLYQYMKTTKYLTKLMQEELPDMVIELNRLINNSFGSFPYKGIKVQSLLVNEAASSPDTVFYKPYYKLSWNDFKGQPDAASNASAVTGSGFTYSAFSEIKNGYLNITISTKCFFLTRSSWIKKELASESMLGHEQLHFDINYLGALKFIDSIAQTNFSIEKWRDELETLNEIKFREISAVQEMYDKESRNGRKGKMQLAWQKKIHALIKENLP